jgi:uncharacterized hydrophobic protein (TIGR00271 family)
MTTREVKMQARESTTQPAKYTILIGIGDELQMRILLSMAVPIARAKQGQVVPLYVGSQSELPAWLTIPDEMRDVVREPHVQVSSDVSSVLLRQVRDLHPDLLLVHWKGTVSRGRYILGRNLDPIIQYAYCDVAVVRVSEPAEVFAARIQRLHKVVVPTGPGPNASLAIELSLCLGHACQVTALRVANRNLGPTAISSQWDVLNQVLAPWQNEPRIQPQVRLAGNVMGGILEEARDGYELVAIGATSESLVDRLLFGNLPQDVAARLDLPLIIVRRRDPAAVATLRRARWMVVQAMPQLTLEERLAVYRQVRRRARTTQDFYAMMVLATAIAALGLLLNSAAVIIGAMLVAPLMSALLGVALGIVQGDGSLVRLGARTAFLGAVIGIGVGALVGLLAPTQPITSEMLSRTRPALLDLAVALISGAAAAYAHAREDVSSALPGVAIAVALVPPLATVGLSSVMGEPGVALGAGLLFLTNLAAIISAAAILFMWLGFRPNAAQQSRARTFKGGILGTAALLTVVTLLLVALTVSEARQRAQDHALENTLAAGVAQMGPNVTLMSWQVAESNATQLRLEVHLASERVVGADELRALEAAIAEQMRTPVRLSAVVHQVTRYGEIVAP